MRVGLVLVPVDIVVWLFCWVSSFVWFRCCCIGSLIGCFRWGLYGSLGLVVFCCGDSLVGFVVILV